MDVTESSGCPSTRVPSKGATFDTVRFEVLLDDMLTYGNNGIPLYFVFAAISLSLLGANIPEKENK